MKKELTKLALFVLSGITLENGAFAQASIASNTITQGTHYLGSFNNAFVDFRANNNLYMRLTTAGNLGVGTTSPGQRLHVHDGAIWVTGSTPGTGPMLMLGGGDVTAPNGQWGIECTANGLNFWRPFSAPNGGNNFLFLKNSNGNVGVRTDNPTANFTVNGNMLVGNPSTVSLPSGYKLYVETGILTERLKVAIKGTGNWADYVFDQNYRLPEISEVSTYIRINKHLPGVPSAEEMVVNGLDVAEMDAKLLEKIEELTLYIIHLQDQINELKSVQTTGN